MGGQRPPVEEPKTPDARRSYDVPSAWTRDGKAVLFHSNRNGQLDIFKQALDQETAEPVVTGPGNKHDPVFTPDGNLILYLQDTDEGKTRIMRVPSSGGAPEMVFEGKGINGLKCSWSPATLCVLGEESPDRKQYIFTAFDPMKGIGRELSRVTSEATGRKVLLGSFVGWVAARLCPRPARQREAYPDIAIVPWRGA